MRRSETIRRRREAYTLIELLVVMGIIALLASLLLSAVMKARDAAKRAQTKAEIGELELAVESFKSTYDVKYIPTALILSNDYNSLAAAKGAAWLPAIQDSQRYLSKVWPRVGWTMLCSSSAIPIPITIPPIPWLRAVF